jgi:hypothetical protein
MRSVYGRAPGLKRQILSSTAAKKSGEVKATSPESSFEPGIRYGMVTVVPSPSDEIVNVPEAVFEA